MVPTWRLAWGKLGDCVAELSSARELFQTKHDAGQRLNSADYKTMTNELALAERECNRIRRLLQESRKETRDQAAVHR